MEIAVQHPEYTYRFPDWVLLRDVLAGQREVKSKGQTYLPLENNEGDENAFAERYDAYLKRANFYNVTSRTLEGVVGQVFSKAPVTEFDGAWEYLEKDISGDGVTLEQQAKDVLTNVMGLGRAFLWVDYAEVEGDTSLADLESGELRPVVFAYKPEDVVNWRTTTRGSKKLLSFVMLRESYVFKDDGYYVAYADQYRELRLTDAGYVVKVWRGGELYTEATPTKRDGTVFEEIPGVFVGIKNNDAAVDKPPMLDMAHLNIAHYRNSADFEESAFMVGQPTPWFTGITEQQLKLMGGKIRLGSRGGIQLPINGMTGLLQVSENSMCERAMAQKEAQMLALGAKLVTDSQVARTATEVTNDKVSEVSILASAARNTSAAYARAFEFCGMFTGTTELPKFELSTDFDLARMTSQEVLAVLAVWQAKGITTEEMRNVYRRGGYATENLEKAISAGVLKEVKLEEPVKAVDNNAKTAA